MNGFAYCVRMHAREAREDGEASERLDRLALWEHASDFTGQERVAPERAGLPAEPDRESGYGAVRAGLRDRFGDAEVGTLVVTVATIDPWNRTRISSH